MIVRVKVKQVERIEREIYLAVEADSIEDAVEAVQCGEVDVPSRGAGWTETYFSIENEEVVAA